MASIWTWLNRVAMLRAAVVITIGDRMAGTLRRQLGDSADRCKIEVIPNWADTDALRPVPKGQNPIAIANGEVDKITVQYSGNMGKTHSLGVFVQVAQRLQDDPRISFVFIGDGLGQAEVVEGIERLGLRNIKLLPPQPWDTFPMSLAMGDIAIITQTAGTEHLSMPSKTYSALAAGSAILACTASDSDLARLVTEKGVGVVCTQNDAVAIEAAIRGLADDPETLVGYRRRARAVAEEHFSFRVIRERFCQVLNDVLVEEAGKCATKST